MNDKMSWYKNLKRRVKGKREKAALKALEGYINRAERLRRTNKAIGFLDGGKHSGKTDNRPSFDAIRREVERAKISETERAQLLGKLELIQRRVVPTVKVDILDERTKTPPEKKPRKPRIELLK